jgi:hypothetical protein
MPVSEKSLIEALFKKRSFFQFAFQVGLYTIMVFCVKNF